MKHFELSPPGPFVRWLPLVLGGVVPLVLLGVILLLATGPAGAPPPEALASLLALPLAAGLIALVRSGRRVDLLPGQLQVRRYPFPRRFAFASLDLGAAEIVDLAQRKDLQPVLRLAGTRMPGFRSGWFWLRDKRRAYVLIGETTRVVRVPRRDGAQLLLGVARPDALLAALRDAAATGR
jgi:hypothetical protein